MCARKKILFVSHSSQFQGAERCLYQLLRGLDRERFSPVVVIPDRGELNSYIEALGIPIVEVPLAHWLMWKRNLSAMLRSFRQGVHDSVERLVEIIRRERIDLVYSSTSAIAEGALAARQTGLPHVWHVHESLGRNPQVIPFIDLPTFFELMESLTTRFVVDSKSVQALIQPYVRTAPVDVIYNGMEHASLAEPLPGGSLPWSAAQPRPPVIIYVGTLNENKGLTTLVDAAPVVLQRHPTAKFLVVGRDIGLQKQTEERLECLGLGHAFHFAGYVPQVLPLIAHAQLLVLPSIADSFPLVVLEAMAVGTPVVATRSGGAEEMVVDGETGYLVPTRDPMTMAQAIAALLDDPARARDMGRKGQERVRTQFTWQHYWTGFHRVFDDLANSKVPGPEKTVVARLLSTLDDNLVPTLRCAALEHQLARQQMHNADQHLCLVEQQKRIEQHEEQLERFAAQVAELERLAAQAAELARARPPIRAKTWVCRYVRAAFPPGPWTLARVGGLLGFVVGPIGLAIALIADMMSGHGWLSLPDLTTLGFALVMVLGCYLRLGGGPTKVREGLPSWSRRRLIVGACSIALALWAFTNLVEDFLLPH